MALGPSFFSRMGSRETFLEILSHLNLKPPVVIKPNWSSSLIFTEAEILDWVLSSIDKEVLVVESYAAWRCPLFLDNSVPRDDNLLEKLGKQTKDDFRENDKWFLNYTGISDVLEKYDVEYVSLSEELWANRLCESKNIDEEVHKHFEPLETSEFYSIVPDRLYNLRGGSLLNLAKPKRNLRASHVSLTAKNLFGLIPSPWRGKYHGIDDQLLCQHIVDINKVYHSLFDVKNIIEGIFTTAETTDNFLDPVIHRDMKLIWGSPNSLDLDALVSTQLGLGPNEVDYLRYAEGRIGSWDKKSIELGMQNPIEFPSA
ncbi:MAG: DUF362 domain-containing protein [Promethearchaeota archaeon]